VVQVALARSGYGAATSQGTSTESQTHEGYSQEIHGFTLLGGYDLPDSRDQALFFKIQWGDISLTRLGNVAMRVLGGSQTCKNLIIFSFNQSLQKTYTILICMLTA
jgi:hypothetical protein